MGIRTEQLQGNGCCIKFHPSGELPNGVRVVEAPKDIGVDTVVHPQIEKFKARLRKTKQLQAERRQE